MESPLSPDDPASSAQTIPQLASLQARAASQEHHARFLEATLERRASGLAACHRSLALLSRRIADIDKRSAEICLASEDAAPSHIPQTPATSPQSSSSSSSGAPSRLALTPLAVSSTFLPSASDKARGKLRDDSASFADLCDAALSDFEEGWEEATERAGSWADAASSSGPPAKAKPKGRSKCIEGLGREATELCLKAIKSAAESPERLAEHILQLDSVAWQELSRRSDGGAESQLELVVGVVRLVGGDEALLRFAERLFHLAFQREKDAAQVEALLLAALDALAAVDACSTRCHGSSPLTLPPAAELHLLSYLRDCAREEGSLSAEHAKASSEGQASRIASRSITSRGARQRRISTPSQSSFSALGTLGNSAAEYLTSGVSGVTSGLSSISGFFVGRAEAQGDETQASVRPPPASNPAALSRFVSSPVLSTSGISFPSVTTTAQGKGEVAAGLDEVKEDLEAVLHAHPRGQGSSDKAASGDARAKLGQGQPSTPRRRTISEAQSNALRQGNIRTIRLEREEQQAAPGVADRSADAFLEKMCSAATSPGLVVSLCRALLQRHFPVSQAPAQHRRVKLLIVVRWFGFAHLRELICQPGRPSRGSTTSRLGGPIIASASHQQLSTQPRPPQRGSLFEAVWTADQDTQLRLSNLHRAVYAKIVEAATAETSERGAQALLSFFKAEPDEAEASVAKVSRPLSSLTLTKEDGRRLLEALGPAFAQTANGESPQPKSGPPITTEALEKALSEAESQEREPRVRGPASATILFTGRTSSGRIVIKDSITALREAVSAKETPSPANGRSANDAATSPTKAFFARRNGSIDPTSRGPSASSVFGTSESAAGGSGFAESPWSDEPASPFHDTLREGKPAYFDVGARAPRPATMGSAPIDKPSQDGPATTPTPTPRAIPSRRGSFRGNNPPSAWRQGSASAATPSSIVTTSLATPRAIAPRIPSLSETAAHQVRRALSSLCKGQYLASLSSVASTPSKIFSAAATSAREAMRFDDAFLFKEAAQVIRAAARETVAQGLREEGVIESQLVEPILSSLSRPLLVADRARVSRIEAAHHALTELDTQLATSRHAARALFSACHEARCRVWYAAHIRALPPVVEARRSSQALLAHSTAGDGELQSNAGQEASQWMTELGIYDFELDATLKSYVRELEPIFSAIAGEASTFFASGLWSREAVLARPLMARGFPESDATMDKQARSKVVLGFGRCSRSLLGPAERPPTIRSGLEDHFLQRVQLLCTGFFLSEALAVVRESSADERLRNALQTQRSEAGQPEVSALARRLEEASAGELLQRFDLDPSPRNKLRSILLLERLVSAVLRSQRAEDQRTPAKQASEGASASEGEGDGAKTPTVRGAPALPPSPVAIRRPLLARQNSDRPSGASPGDISVASPRRPLSVRSTALVPRRVLSLYDDEDAMSVASGQTYGAQPHSMQKPLDSIQDLLANLEALETGKGAIGRWRLVASQQQQQHSQQSSSNAAQGPSQGGSSQHEQDLTGSMSEHSEVASGRQAPDGWQGTRDGSSRAPSASAGLSEMGSLRGRPASVGASATDVGRDVDADVDVDEDDEANDQDQVEVEASDDFEPTTDDMVGALEELLALSAPGDGESDRERERTAPRELLLNLQIVAAFTPTTILDLKDEGKAFWDLCLAASMQRQLAGADAT